MLRAEVKYRIDGFDKTASLVVKPGPGGIVATLHMMQLHEHRYIDGYQAWAESGFAMLARSFAEFMPELCGEAGIFSRAEVRVTASAIHAAAKNPFCVALLTCGPSENRIAVSGPVIGLVMPVGLNLPENLADLLQFVFALCDPALSEGPTKRSVVPTYSGSDVEPFIFLDSLPVQVVPWFITYLKKFNPDALQRGELIATVRAYEDFCNGVVR